MSDVPWLSLLVLLPLVGAVAVPFVRGSAALTKQVGLGVSLGTLALAVAVALQYDVDGGMQLIVERTRLVVINEVFCVFLLLHHQTLP